MTINAIKGGAPVGEPIAAASWVLHPKVSLEKAQWNSITHLLNEAETWVAPGKLEGLPDSEIRHAWRKVCPDHEIPPELAEFLRRAGQDAPFINSDFADSYRPEHYEFNREFADRFLGEFPSGGASTVLHRQGEDGKPSSSVLVIACNVQRQDYYCLDASDKDSKVFWVHNDHGDLKEEATTILEFLQLELINHWLKRKSFEG